MRSTVRSRDKCSDKRAGTLFLFFKNFNNYRIKYAGLTGIRINRLSLRKRAELLPLILLFNQAIDCRLAFINASDYGASLKYSDFLIYLARFSQTDFSADLFEREFGNIKFDYRAISFLFSLTLFRLFFSSSASIESRSFSVS